MGDDLLIASPWPEAERSKLATAFREWAKATPGAATDPVRITWIPLAPGDDLTRVVRRRLAPDLLLGGGAADYQRLAQGRCLVPVECTAHPLWCVTRRTPIGMALNPRALRNEPAKKTDIPGDVDSNAAPGPPGPRSNTVTFDDFRHDPIAIAWAQGQLAEGSWAEGYARLVRSAGHPRRIGRQAGSAVAAVERGDAAMTPAPALRAQGRSTRPGAPYFVAAEDAPVWVEGVAVLRGGSNPSLAQEFIRFLADRGQSSRPSADDSRDDPAATALLADLLGSTLVDAQDELWAAWARLEATGHPEHAERWMTEPPPWPPASIDKLLKRGEGGGTLLETLTSEIAPEADVRAWLLRSWLAPARPIDGALLAELARGADGRLAREPRFRAWLRAEWTAWARQRYRRVARLTGAALP